MKHVSCIAIAFVAVLPLAFGDDALAQTIPMTPDFAAYVKSPANRQAVSNALRKQASAWFDCADVTLDPKVTIKIQEPIQIVRDGAALKSLTGAWTESESVTACGETRLHHVFSIARGMNIARLARLVGTSIADAKLQNDTLPAVRVAAKTAAPDNCEKAFVTDTQVVAREGDGGIPPTDGRKPWTEEWTLRACSRDIVVPVTFTPTPPRGADYAISTKDIRARPAPKGIGQKL